MEAFRFASLPGACFDAEAYLAAQVGEIFRRMAETPEGGRTYVEFGGKSFDDRHAARVLPGYDPDLKLRLLRELSEAFEVVVVVSARDILRPRIRGDTQLWYDRETIRLVTNLRRVGIQVRHGVVSMVRDDGARSDRRRLDAFRRRAERDLRITFVEHGFIDDYPSPSVLDRVDPFSRAPRLAVGVKNVLVLSPGGGSSKFGVILSQLWHDFAAGANSVYLKFETFPVFTLPPDHPVNVAFMAATADLGNVVVRESEGGLTTYDKDIENFQLLSTLIKRRCPDAAKNPMSGHRRPTDMGVNRLTAGFLDDERIQEAACAEIVRRIARYHDEIVRRIESPDTIRHIERLLPPSLRHLAG